MEKLSENQFINDSNDQSNNSEFLKIRESILESIKDNIIESNLHGFELESLKFVLTRLASILGNNTNRIDAWNSIKRNCELTEEYLRDQVAIADISSLVDAHKKVIGHF